MNKITYEFSISFDMGEVLGPIKELLTTVNTELASAGYDERLQCRNRIITGSVELKREPTEQEKEKMKSIVLEQFHQAFPKYDVKLDSFRRKSGNVEQLVEV